jgi:hypothetical protein
MFVEALDPNKFEPRRWDIAEIDDVLSRVKALSFEADG